MDICFQTGGPLSSDSPVYIERRVDREALSHSQKMHYIQITEPRQQGKTSLIYRLRSVLHDRDCIFAYVDAEDLKNDNETAWYQNLAARLGAQLKTSVEYSESLPVDSMTWRSFLETLTVSLTTEPQRKLIIAIDEIGSVPVNWAEGFFRVLREVYTVREFEVHFHRLSFILAGAFDPRNLIQDPKISPFNVAQRINIEDLNFTQVQTLVSRLGLSDNQLDNIADRVCYWADGQPYLTQKLCLYLADTEGDITAESVDAAVDRLFLEDINHLPRIARDIEADSSLSDYACQIIRGGVKFSPVVNQQHFHLAYVLGVIKPDKNGCCRVRNRIYERAFPNLNQPPVFVSTRKVDTSQSVEPLSPSVPGSGAPPETPPFQQIKSHILETRRENLIAEYEAANKQLDDELNEANRLRLKRRIKELEQEISEAESELRSL